MNRDVLTFLSQLAQNNRKEWMDANRSWYLEVKQEVLGLAGEILAGLSVQEPEMAALRPKDCIFRQNRDIRFSANKDPYKTNMGIYFSSGGKKSPGSGYYVHLQPGECFLAGGIWMPAAETLKKIRQEIDYSGQELLQIIEEPGFSGVFGTIKGEQLKTSPRDYPADHPFIDLLRLKSFIVTYPISDQEVLSGKLVAIALEKFAIMKPFCDFLDRAVEDTESGEGVL